MYSNTMLKPGSKFKTIYNLYTIKLSANPIFFSILSHEKNAQQTQNFHTFILLIYRAL
ncbi:hypothetical protein HNP69_001559 [Chryseobacterium koreense]|nr:hypothetical protein [Chryseobacterium koreense]